MAEDVPTVTRTACFKEANGDWSILPFELYCDMGNNGVPYWPLHLKVLNKRFKFTKTGISGSNMYVEVGVFAAPTVELKPNYTDLTDEEKVYNLEGTLDQRDSEIERLQSLIRNQQNINRRLMDELKN